MCIYIYIYVYTCVYSLCTVYMYVTYMYIGAPHSGLCRDSSKELPSGIVNMLRTHCGGEASLSRA